MLEQAMKYKDELIQVLREACLKNRQSFSYYDTGYDFASIDGGIKIEPNSSSKHQFVSVSNGVVVGYIGYSISLADYRVYNLQIINFNRDKVTFALDLKASWERIFEVYKFRKINFTVFVGNPVERLYDMLVDLLGGRVVGIQKQHCRLADRKFYDQKIYEILKEDYLNARGTEWQKSGN